MGKLVFTTETGQRPSDEGRDEIPTRDERRRPISLDRPQKPGTLNSHLKISPEMLRYLREHGIRLSDCKIVNATTLELP